jgi:hypothetical protein
VTDIYGFWGGPTYRAATRGELFSAALDMPMSAGSTFWDQAKGGALESFGLGSAIRDFKTPDGAPLAAERFERPEQFKARRDAFAAENKVLDEEAYKASPYFRDGVPWDASMTEDRAAALATMHDATKVREFYAEKRPIISFLGNLTGQALDPINYIPVAGPSVRAAAVARMGLVKGVAATAALDAAANTAIAGLATRETRRSYGDDVSWQAMISEIATAALIGSAFGTVGGALERRAGLRADALRRDAEVKVQTLKATQEARIALNEAIGGLANDGEVRLSPNATAPIERAIERVVYVTPEDRVRTIDRIVQEDVPLGPAPLKPVTLTQFLASRSVGGIRDEGGELASMGLSRKFVPGGGALVRQSGKSLDYAREAAAEAGFFDHIYGDPDRATAMSTNDDLLRLLGAESRGDFTYSDRADGGRSLANAEYQLSVEAREQYRRALEEVNDAITEMGIDHRLDDGVLRRAAELLGDGKMDGFSALERAIEEDYRAFSDAMDELGEGFSGEPGYQLPFFDTDAPAGGTAGEARGVGQAGRGLGNAADRRQLARVGGAQGEARTLDTSPARPDPIPEGRTEAEAKVAKPENYKALADQYRVDPETGTFPEEAELRQLAQEGRLSEEDMAVLDDADAAYQDGASYGEALKSVVGCLL